MNSPRVVVGATVADATRDNRLLHRLRRFLTTERLNTVRFIVFFWFAVRLGVFLVWGFLTPSTQGDVLYYFDRIDRRHERAPGRPRPHDDRARPG